MGWGAGDSSTIIDCKVKLSLTKSQAYNLESVIRDIEHDDNRVALQDCVKALNCVLTDID